MNSRFISNQSTWNLITVTVKNNEHTHTDVERQIYLPLADVAVKLSLIDQDLNDGGL